MRFVFTIFGIIFTMMSLLEPLCDSFALFRILNFAALFCWGAVAKLSLPPGVYNHQLYDKMLEIPDMTSESSESSESSEEELIIEAAI